ncbi:MAG: glycoside hydrolase family 16 protein [Bacteroidota bacterium]
MRIKKTGILFGLGVLTFLIIVFTIDMNGQNDSEIISGSKNVAGTIEFSGYTWTIKDSYGKHTGPGNNYFSGSKENVYVDANGKLHLRLTMRNDKWYCPEVRMQKNLGYGSYVFYIDSLETPLDKDIVVGLFMYDREDSLNFHKEVDIEFSQWGKDNSLNSQYVMQPKEDEAYRFNTDFTKKSKHTIELRKRKIAFKSSYETEDNKGCLHKNYSHHKIKPNKEYMSINERVSINVWLYRMSEPSNLKEFEIVISKFEFKPFRFPGIINPAPNPQ